jgi:hypothetical protein
MTKIPVYRYIGYNGTVTTPILLDGVNHLKLVELTADNGCYLTNGERKVRRITVQPEAVEQWVEVKGDID